MSKENKTLGKLLYEQMERVQKKINKNIKPLQDVIRKMQEQTEKLREELSRVKDQIGMNEENGWWKVDYILDEIPAPAVHEAIRREGEYGTFTNLVIRELEKNNYQKLQTLANFWTDQDFLSDNRKKILKDSIDAHLQERYTLSIPAILPQIEYLLKKEIEFEDSELYKIIDQESPKKLLLDDYMTWFPIYSFCENKLFDGVNPNTHPGELNRHIILHGEIDDYASRVNSAKAILFLDKIIRLRDNNGND